MVDVAIEKINVRLESYLGINDNELGKSTSVLLIKHAVVLITG